MSTRVKSEEREKNKKRLSSVTNGPNSNPGVLTVEVLSEEEFLTSCAAVQKVMKGEQK